MRITGADQAIGHLIKWSEKDEWAPHRRQVFAEHFELIMERFDISEKEIVDLLDEAFGMVCGFVLDKAGMLSEAFRVLRRGGRFALYNMCPQESDDWLYYAYFPEAKTRDFADFWPPDAIVSEMTATGFARVEVARRHVLATPKSVQTLQAALHAKRRDVLSESRMREICMSTASVTWRSCCRPCGSASGIRNCYRCPTRRMRPGCGASSATLTIRRRPRCAPSICALSRSAAISGRSSVTSHGDL